MLCNLRAKVPVAGPRVQRSAFPVRKSHIVRAQKQGGAKADAKPEPPVEKAADKQNTKASLEPKPEPPQPEKKAQDSKQDEPKKDEPKASLAPKPEPPAPKASPKAPEETDPKAQDSKKDEPKKDEPKASLDTKPQPPAPVKDKAPAKQETKASSESKPEASTTQPKTEAKTEAKTESKTESKSDVKTESKSDAKSDAKGDEKSTAPSAANLKVEKMSSKDRKEIDEVVATLKAQGLDTDVAQKVLKAWQDQGVTDASGMRGQTLKLGLSVLLTQGIQTAFDSLAAFSSFNTAAVISQQQFFGAGFLGAAIDTLGWYFAIGVLFDLFSLAATATATVKMGGKTEQMYAAVVELAGEKSGLTLVDKVQQAVSATKVAIALNSISTALKMDAKEKQAVKIETLDRLGAMFLLGDAEKKYGFVATDKYDMSQDEAALLATTFSKYDVNSDFRLEFSEFKRLCQDSNFELDDAETKAAMKVLDTRGSGYIEFDEFASWWVESVQVDSAPESSSASE